MMILSLSRYNFDAAKMKRYVKAMSDEKPYHHGDLRAALLAAAEIELAEKGIEAFSLRQVAKRAGVSHAAPAHHFGDANGLLTALATHGFEVFLATQKQYEANAAKTPRDQLIASGLGYVGFARARPALFRLMFGSERTDYGDASLKTAANASFMNLVTLVQQCGSNSAQDVAMVWVTAHGLADLLIGGRLNLIEQMSEVALQDMLGNIIARSLPEAG
jgi:AcrR family transcriptional regulator